MQLRATKKQQLVKFLEEKVGFEWSEFRMQRLKVETRLQHADDVSAVTKGSFGVSVL